jgi:hypothetical protein
MSVTRRQRCSDFHCHDSPKRVLLVGAERPDEFQDAFQLLRRGFEVTVVNPRTSQAARSFRRHGGCFLPATIESLPPELAKFDLICEHYPYPTGRYFVPAADFARARLTRLARGGCWVLFTESARYARQLTAALEEGAARREFSLRLALVPENLAPASSYPPVKTRLRLIFQRRG